MIVVEGEKSADAAAQLLPYHVCLTRPNGSLAAAKANWKPLGGRNVVVWPDADEAGAKYADAVKKLLAPIVASIRLLTPPTGVKPAGMPPTPSPKAGVRRALAG